METEELDPELIRWFSWATRPARIGERVEVASGRYEGYRGAVMGGDFQKNYITVNVWGIHCLRFEPSELVRVA